MKKKKQDQFTFELFVFLLYGTFSATLNFVHLTKIYSLLPHRKMSDLQALHIFVRKPVSEEMIHFLVCTTNSVIQVSSPAQQYPTPPTSPSGKQPSDGIPTLSKFIERLVRHSNVPTSTLMASLVYLTRLRDTLPPDAVGMETTRHRIFLASLILAAKVLNDSSPLNKHWCKYTNGLLSMQEVNASEAELIDYLGWSNLRITNKDLVRNLGHFLEPIKWKLRRKNEHKLSEARSRYLKHSKSSLSLHSSLKTSSTMLSIASEQEFDSPTPPLFSFGKSSISSSSSRRSVSSPLDLSSTSVPSLISSSSSAATSSSTLSSALAENHLHEASRPNLGDIPLKTLHLSGYGKENNRPGKDSLLSNRDASIRLSTYA